MPSPVGRDVNLVAVSSTLVMVPLPVGRDVNLVLHILTGSGRLACALLPFYLLLLRRLKQSTATMTKSCAARGRHPACVCVWTTTSMHDCTHNIYIYMCVVTSNTEY